ncbi:MAG: threonylcarbamoyl-AMP synthase [Candidatus Nealsonbacteria bacterium]|nr:MAG: threonylcarbamoyl-AMP synthase [Candidatus Nealsonbacteria bacterium]
MEILKAKTKNLVVAINIIKKGGVVVCPTDTVYGLIADAKNKNAVKKIFKIKKRVLKKPLPVFVKDLKMARSLADINKTQEKILKKVWPGKVTAVLKAKSTNLPIGILSKDKKIGLRMPRYKLLNLLLEKLNYPLAQTSANISRKKASTKIREIVKQFKKEKYQPDLILDAGNLKPSLSSTVIDLTNFKILRKGQIQKEEISQIFNNLIK